MRKLRTQALSILVSFQFLAGCVAPITYYSKANPGPTLKTVGIFVAPDGFLAGRQYMGNDAYVPPNRGSQPQHRGNYRPDGSDTQNHPYYASYGTSYEEWSKPMTLETVLRQQGEIRPKEGLFKKKQNWLKAYVKSDELIQPIPIDPEAGAALANALKQELESRGYAVKILDFGSSPTLTVSQAIDQAKSAGCDSVLAAQYRITEAWKSQSWSESSTNYNGAGQQVTTTTEHWFDFKGIKYAPRASLWSADKQQLWVGGNFSQHQIEKATQRKVGWWESKKASMSRSWGQMKAGAGKLTQTVTLGAKGKDLEKSGQAQAGEKSPEQKAREDYENAWKERLVQHALLTGTAVSPQSYQDWFKSESEKPNLEDIKSKLSQQFGDNSAMAAVMGNLVNNLVQKLSEIQKKYEQENISRPKAMELAAQNTAKEIISPTAEFVTKKETNNNKAFPWAPAKKAAE